MDIAAVKPLFVPDIANIPYQFQLYQAYPNPFNPQTKIKYSIPQATHVSLKIYDLLGHQVRILVNQFKTPGTYTVEFDAKGFASGVYYYVLMTEKNKQIKKMTLIK
jgi:hypothetical protein